MKFTHLHVHSHYSLLDGLAKIDQLVKRAAELEMDSIALTDHGNLYGAIEFYQKAKKAGIKPIIGCEMYIAANRMQDKNPGIDDKRYHLTVLASNEEGYHNLINLVSKAHLEGFYYKPRVDKELLSAHAGGLIALSGCFSGEIGRALQYKKPDVAERIIREYQEVFGKENFYLEVQPHMAFENQRAINEGLFALAPKVNAKIVATNDIHYTRPDDAEAQDILVSVQTGSRVKDENRLNMTGANLSLRSGIEMAELFPHNPEVIRNTQEIAERVNISIELGKNHLPRFTVPAGHDANSYLTQLCHQGLEYRYGAQAKKNPAIKERLAYELNVINQTGFASYFLIVHDFIAWARMQNIVIGPGRGSAAGSLVSYVLRITNIDPLRYNLLFERFLNPDRISMPDIDLDFADTRRDEVINYVADKYGHDHVAQIITFGTMAARAAIRDTGRALGIPYSFCDSVAKMIPFTPQGEKVGWLKKSLATVKEFRDLYDRDEQARKLIDAAMKLEGVVRHASTHACGVVISPHPLQEYVPLQHAVRHGESKSGTQNQVVVTQYEMHAIEDLGLLKMDFLGLRNLSIIERTLKNIQRTSGTIIDIDTIPLDDKNVFELFQKGETTGLFQFESSGMKRYLKELKPTELEDLIAMVSLYRPGPIELIPNYIKRKHKKERIEYLHPRLEPILKNTYGIGVYQEQMMQIARDLAGYTLSQADTLRKAIGKKIKSLLNEQQAKLTSGMIANGIDAKTATAIWELFPPFARYGFNRCLTGDTLVSDPQSGQQITLKNLYEKRAKIKDILSIESCLKLNHRPIADVVYNGSKKVWRLTTRSGRTIKATANHPFLTTSGWKHLDHLGTREKIAVPRLLPEPQKWISVERHKIAVLGYLLAEGNFCHPHGFYFYSMQEEEINDYLEYLTRFDNTTGTLNRSKSAVSVYAKRKKIKKPSEAVIWIKSLGLSYKKATEKFFPSFIFQLRNADLALLIAKMFQGDGCINLKRNDPQIFYATSSRILAQGLQHLLLRFEILSTIHTKRFKYRGGIKIGYTVTMSRYDNIKKFIAEFGPHLIGEKKKSAERILTTHPIINGTLSPWSARGSFDTIPATLVLNPLRQCMVNRAMSIAEFARENQISERLFGFDKKKIGYLRETVDLIAVKTQDRELLRVAESDIYWDEVKMITYVGIEDTYDLTIKETHNFVANDIIVHNSHAACYALVAYQTGYLKAHYPTEFMTALLAAESADIEKIAFFVEETRAMNIDVLPPDVNESFADFTVVDAKKIRFGLGAVKNVGANIVQAIIDERAANNRFASMSNFAERVQHKDFNKKSIESLVKCGALDAFGERGNLLGNIEMILEYNRESQKQKNAGQFSLFGMADHAPVSALRLREITPAKSEEKLHWEKELLGLYVTQHPISAYQEKFVKNNILPIQQLTSGMRNQIVSIGGLITGIQKIITKSGEPMLFVKLEDTTAKTEVLVFPKILAENPDLWKEENVLFVKGRVSDKDGIPKILCEKAARVLPPNAS